MSYELGFELGKASHHCFVEYFLYTSGLLKAVVATNEPPTFKLPLEPKTMSLGFTKNTLAVPLVRIKPSILEILLPVTRVKMLLKTSQASIRLQSFYYLAINLIKFHSQTQIFRKNLKILQTFTNIALKLRRTLLIPLHQHPIHTSDTPLRKLRQQFLDRNLQSRIVTPALEQKVKPRILHRIRRSVRKLLHLKRAK